MRAGCIAIAISAIVSLLTAFATGASAYCLKQVAGVSGTSVWKDTVSYYVSDTLTDTGFKAAIDAAFKTWQDVACATIEFTDAGTFSIASTPFGNHGAGIYVYWYTDAAGYPSTATNTAYTTYGVDAQGTITYASIAVNAFSSVSWSTNPSHVDLDLQGEMTALIGQVIGIAKSNVSDSVMNGIMTTGDTSKRQLKQDDIFAVTYLYLEPGCPAPPAPDPDGCSSGTTPPAGDGSVTPPAGDGGVTPPAGDGGVTPPAGDGGGSTTDFGTTPPGSCTNDDQCGTGQSCSPAGYCVLQDNDSGCCAMAADRPLLTPLLVGAALLGLLFAGRRRPW